VRGGPRAKGQGPREGSRVYRRPLTLLFCALVLAFTGNLAGAQTPGVPKRPNLDANADTNDWEAYYAYGVRNLQRFPSRSLDAFYWASRLAPWSADPLYAQWVAFHMRDIGRFRRYLDDDQKILTAPDVRQADSLVNFAFLRNPFVHRAMQMALFNELPGRWGGDVFTRAWLAYANQKLDKANELFGRAIADKPDTFYHLRQVRAALFVAGNQYDSALSEMTALLEKTRQLDEKELVRVYESKAFYEYAIGRLLLARGNNAAAREAFERALVEDLAYGPAHVWIATLSEAKGDEERAISSYAQAVDLTPSDGVYRYQYAVVLMKAHRAQEGLEQINRAIALEPYYADSYVFKASAHEQLGQPDSARIAYRAYLVRATRNAQNRALATRRLAALESRTPSP
jgi:tetratricopeptide (TPR) repeat protein